MYNNSFPLSRTFSTAVELRERKGKVMILVGGKRKSCKQINQHQALTQTPYSDFYKARAIAMDTSKSESE